MLEIRNYNPDDELFKRILSRTQDKDGLIWRTVNDIIKQVKTDGDKAIFHYTKKFDHIELTAANLQVTTEELTAGKDQVSEDFLIAASLAINNIRNFHNYQIRQSYVHDDGDGVILTKRVVPISRAGVYCPAGEAPLFSTLMMNVIPAQIAKVEKIVIATPPGKNGQVDPHILATASMLGIKNIYKMGSAWAIAALAYGTESIPKVDKIVGPGNIYVATAKKMLYGQVGIDSIAGPSELVIICDKTANPRYLAADLLSQVEHGSGLEAGVLFTDSNELAKAINTEVEKQLKHLSRKEAISKCLANFGAIFVVRELKEAISAANELAPEHLEIQTSDPQDLSLGVKNAGAIFLGANSPEPVGDYFCGTNHVLPTGGTARFSSSLSVYDFLKDISIIKYSRERLLKCGRHIIKMAECEGLSAHAASIKVRLEASETGEL